MDMCCSAKSFRFPVSGDRLLAQGISASTATSFHTSKKQQPCSINHAVQTFFFLKRLPSLHTSCARLFQSTQEKADSRLIAHSSECLRTLPVAPQHQHILVTARRTFKREEAQGTTRPTIIRMMRVEGEVSLAWNNSSFNPEGNLTSAIESDGTYIPSGPARKKGFFKKVFGCTCVSTVWLKLLVTCLLGLTDFLLYSSNSMSEFLKD